LPLLLSFRRTVLAGSGEWALKLAITFNPKPSIPNPNPKSEPSAVRARDRERKLKQADHLNPQP
jgi:hypothetical protein